MLGKTASGLYWMFRYFERSEYTARLVEAGFRISLTHVTSGDQWESVLTTAGVKDAYLLTNKDYRAANVINFLLRDPANPSSVVSMIDAARNNAKLVRTALTREVWEATNECWMVTRKTLSKPVEEREMPEVLAVIRRHGALVRAAMEGTMLRKDTYDFARIGTFVERADNTARILDVKYYVLLPTAFNVGSQLDNAQWEMILRSVSALRSYRWLGGGETSARAIAEFLILDRRMPRSLAFCYSKIVENLDFLAEEYDIKPESQALAQRLMANLKSKTIDQIFDYGLHEFIADFISNNNGLGAQIEADFRFNG